MRFWAQFKGFKLRTRAVLSWQTKEAEDTPHKQLRTRMTPMAHTTTQAETLLHNLERAAVGIDFHVNPHKTEYTRFNQRGDISTLNDSSLKLEDKFTDLESSVSSTETDIKTWLSKVWTAIDSLIFVTASHQTGLDTRSIAQRLIIVGFRGGEGRAWTEARTQLNCASSLTHLV